MGSDNLKKLINITFIILFAFFIFEIAMSYDNSKSVSYKSNLEKPKGLIEAKAVTKWKYRQNADLGLLSRIINGEGRGEKYIGQVAIGAVIINRTRDPKFPHTIAGVVYQPGAFTAIVDGQINARITSNSKRAAQDAINGWDPTGGCTFYYNPAKTTSKWIWSKRIVKVIGKHYFCK